MICNNKKCSKDLPDGAVFCPWCGRKQIREPKKRSHGNGIGSVFKHGDKWVAEKTVGWSVDPLPPDAPPDQKPKKHRVTVRRTFDTRKNAQAALPSLTYGDHRPRNGTATQRKKTEITLKELYDQWLPTHKRGKSTIACYRSGFRIYEPLWFTRMQDLDVDDLQDCMDDSDAGRRTLENARTCLGLVYKYGIPRDAVPKDRNLASFLKINEPGSLSKKPGLSQAELEKVRIAAEAGDRTAILVYCHCLLGFRPSALLQLKVADYNPEEKAFTGGIKTEAGKGRTVTVSPKIQAYVDALIAEAGEGFVFGDAGKEIILPEYRDRFYDLLDRLGIDNTTDKDGRHRLTPHSCRHTFATLMKRAEGNDTDKLALIGHTSASQLREYQDVSFEDLRKITDQL